MLQIRLAQMTDAAEIQAIYAPSVEHSPISFELAPPSAEEMAARIAKTIKQHPWLVCTDGSAICGYAYASEHRERKAYQWATTVSVYIDQAWQRHSLGRALYTALFGVLAAQGYYAAYAGITLPNAGSVGLHEAMGFTSIGAYTQVGFKAGAWHDVGWWQRDIQPRQENPADPTPIGQIVGTPAWHAAIAAGEQIIAKTHER